MIPRMRLMMSHSCQRSGHGGYLHPQTGPHDDQSDSRGTNGTWEVSSDGRPPYRAHMHPGVDWLLTVHQARRFLSTMLKPIVCDQMLTSWFMYCSMPMDKQEPRVHIAPVVLATRCTYHHQISGLVSRVYYETGQTMVTDVPSCWGALPEYAYIGRGAFVACLHCADHCADHRFQPEESTFLPGLFGQIS